MGNIRTRQDFQPLTLVRRTTSQTFTNATNTALQFDVEEYDPQNLWNGTQFTVPVTGQYKIELNSVFAYSGGTVTAIDISCALEINAAATPLRFSRLVYSGSIAANTGLPVVGIIPVRPFTAGDVLRIIGNATFTGATTITMLGSINSLAFSRLV